MNILRNWIGGVTPETHQADYGEHEGNHCSCMLSKGTLGRCMVSMGAGIMQGASRAFFLSKRVFWGNFKSGSSVEIQRAGGNSQTPQGLSS
jgi:hypothetical protein